MSKIKEDDSDESSRMLCLGLGVTPVGATGKTSLKAQYSDQKRYKRRLDI